MTVTTGMLMRGKMSIGMLKMDSTPMTAINRASTMNVYGRRRASLTIHMGVFRRLVRARTVPGIREQSPPHSAPGRAGMHMSAYARTPRDGASPGRNARDTRAMLARLLPQRDRYVHPNCRTRSVDERFPGGADVRLLARAATLGPPAAALSAERRRMDRRTDRAVARFNGAHRGDERAPGHRRAGRARAAPDGPSGPSRRRS